MNNSNTTSDTFLQFIRKDGFVGQGRLLEELSILLEANCLGTFSIAGGPGSGRSSIVKAIAAFLGYEFLSVGPNELISVATTTSLLENLGNRFLLVSDVRAIRNDVIQYLAIGDAPYAFPVRVAFELEPSQVVESYQKFVYGYSVGFHKVRNPLFAIEPYGVEDLLEVARLYSIKKGCDLTEAQIKMVVEQYCLHRKSRLPGTIIASIEYLSGFESEALDEAIIKSELGKYYKPNERATGSEFRTSEEIMVSAHDPDDSSFRAMLMAMNGRDFEEFVCSLLKRLAFQVSWASAGKDGGIDISAINRDPLHGGKFLFQCKRYQEKSTVGRPTLQEFVGAAHNDKQHPRLVFITTSSFTREAQSYAAQIGMRLIDFNTLKALSRTANSPLQ